MIYVFSFLIRFLNHPCNFKELVLQDYLMDFDVFWCKIKKRFCLFRFFSLLITFVELKTTKTLRVVKKSVLSRCFLQTRGLVLSLIVSKKAWKITENVDAPGHRLLFRQGTYLKLTQFNFQTNRSLGALFARGTTPALSIFFCPVTLTQVQILAENECPKDLGNFADFGVLK